MLYAARNEYEIYVYKKYPDVPVSSNFPLKEFLFDKNHETIISGIPTINVTISCALACEASDTESL